MAEDEDEGKRPSNVIPLPPPKPRQKPQPAFVVTAESLLSQFEARFGGRLRYVSEWGYWMEWGRGLWTRDYCALHKAVTLLAELGAGANKKSRGKIDSHSMINGTERLARASPVFHTPVGWFDADPWMLNTPGGIVDLHNGQMRAAVPEDFCTKLTAVTPQFGCASKPWADFLATVTNKNTDLVAYLMRMLGYCLTGLTVEQCMFFLHGSGANGKSVFISTAQFIMGDYATSAAMETFTAGQEKHREELACLRGARLVVATETEEGKAWNEARIKQLTGGDKIRANFMRQNSFEFTPNFKTMIGGNHVPNLKSVDEATRRRQQIIPFEVFIPEIKRDKQLTSTLCREGGAILAAMIAGCQDWQQQAGLKPPIIVADATDDYLDEEAEAKERLVEYINLWLAERCMIGHGVTVKTLHKDLYADYLRWAGERFIGSKNFARLLKAKAKASNGAFVYDRIKDRGYRKLALKPWPEPEEDRRYGD